MAGNGINAFLAHKERVGNDNNFVRGIIDSYTFIGFGVVTEYTDERITVSCGSMVFTNVEVVVLGVNGWGIKAVPAVDDRVILFSTQTPVPDIKSFEASGTMPAYDLSGLKAIPITDSSASQLITVQDGQIQITGDTKLTINSDGINLEDKNGNTFVSNNADGVVINGNLQIKRS